MVADGYKQTDIGVIPEDWEVKKLGDITNINIDNLTSSTNLDYLFKYISIEDVKYGVLKNIEEVLFRNAPSRARRKVKKGDILLSTVRPNLKSHLHITYNVNNWICSTGFSLLRPINKLADSGYIYNHLFHSIVNKQIDDTITGSNYPAINSNDVKNILIPIPPKQEQQAIATALSDTDELINSLEKLLSKKEAIKTGTMQELLTGKKRLNGFSGEWEEKSLGSIGTFSKGSGVKKDEAKSGDIACIRYGEIYTLHNEYIKSFASYISRTVMLTAKKLKQGDLLFAGSGETKEDIGKCVAYLNDFIAYAGGDIVILSPRNVDSLFMGFLLNIPTIAIQKASKGQGDAVVHISASSLAEIEVRIPKEIKEQQAISTILSDMDSDIDALKTKLSKVKAIKEGMMQELLTGKIRLI